MSSVDPLDARRWAAAGRRSPSGRDVGGLLVAHLVPQPVGGKDEQLAPLIHVHCGRLRLRHHPHLEVRVAHASRHRERPLHAPHDAAVEHPRPLRCASILSGSSRRDARWSSVSASALPRGSTRCGSPRRRTLPAAAVSFRRHPPHAAPDVLHVVGGGAELLFGLQLFQFQLCFRNMGDGDAGTRPWRGAAREAQGAMCRPERKLSSTMTWRRGRCAGRHRKPASEAAARSLVSAAKRPHPALPPPRLTAKRCAGRV